MYNHPDLSFGPQIVKLMGNVCDDAWREFLATHPSFDLLSENETKREIVRCIMSAIVDGERDPARLRELALRAIEIE
jgi:hypothetical protein